MVRYEIESTMESAIEITPAMMEKGVRAFRANQTDDPNEQQVRRTVTEIFAAMARVSCQKEG
jgi:hypothetical protein